MPITTLAPHKLEIIADGRARNPQFDAAMTILAGDPRLATDQRVSRHLVFEGRFVYVEFEAMLEEIGWSTTEELLLRCAWSLYDNRSGKGGVSLYMLASRLDLRQLRLVVSGMARLANDHDLFATVAGAA